MGTDKVLGVPLPALLLLFRMLWALSACARCSPSRQQQCASVDFRWEPFARATFTAQLLFQGYKLLLNSGRSSVWRKKKIYIHSRAQSISSQWRSDASSYLPQNLLITCEVFTSRVNSCST
ncbi:hypothetical protein AOLI_G00184020 [Acnodon oligacanthus]